MYLSRHEYTLSTLCRLVHPGWETLFACSTAVSVSTQLSSMDKVVGLNPTFNPSLTSLSSCHSAWNITKKSNIWISTFQAVVYWRRCSRSPSEAESLCVFTKVYHSSGSTDLRPLISSLRSQTCNDPHLSANVQLVRDSTTACEFRWSRGKRIALTWWRRCAHPLLIRYRWFVISSRRKRASCTCNRNPCVSVPRKSQNESHFPLKKNTPVSQMGAL